MPTKLLVLAFALAACDAPPEIGADADAPHADAGTPDAGALAALGSWSATAMPTDSCSYGSLVGGAVLDVTPGTIGGDRLAVAVNGAPVVVVAVDECNATSCALEWEEGAGAARVMYQVTFTVGALDGVALSGPSCAIAVEGERI